MTTTENKRNVVTAYGVSVCVCLLPTRDDCGAKSLLFMSKFASTIFMIFCIPSFGRVTKATDFLHLRPDVRLGSRHTARACIWRMKEKTRKMYIIFRIGSEFYFYSPFMVVCPSYLYFFFTTQTTKVWNWMKTGPFEGELGNRRRFYREQNVRNSYNSLMPFIRIHVHCVRTISIFKCSFRCHKLSCVHAESKPFSQIIFIWWKTPANTRA